MNKLISNLGLTIGEVESRRDKLALTLKWALVMGVGSVIAPLAFHLLTAVVALMVSGLAALATIAFAPLIAMKMANWKMSGMLGEAVRNPIPTLENELLSRKAALRQAREHLQVAIANVESFVAQAREAAVLYPDTAARWRQSSAKAQALTEVQKRSFRQATEGVEKFEHEVERCRVEWKLVVAEAAINKSLEGALSDPMGYLLGKTAIQAVTDRMNQAFAGLELSLLEEEEATNLQTDLVTKRLAQPNRIERLPRP